MVALQPAVWEPTVGAEVTASRSAVAARVALRAAEDAKPADAAARVVLFAAVAPPVAASAGRAEVALFDAAARLGFGAAQGATLADVAAENAAAVEVGHLGERLFAWIHESELARLYDFELLASWDFSAPIAPTSARSAVLPGVAASVAPGVGQWDYSRAFRRAVCRC